MMILKENIPVKISLIWEPTPRPTFRNVFAQLAMNIIERGMIREAEARSLEENNKPIVATSEQMESLGNYQRVTKEEVSEDKFGIRYSLSSLKNVGDECIKNLLYF